MSLVSMLMGRLRMLLSSIRVFLALGVVAFAVMFGRRAVGRLGLPRGMIGCRFRVSSGSFTLL